MKKIMLISFAFSLLSTSAFAADPTSFTSAGGVGTGVVAGFKASKQVVVACNSSTQSYAAAADHMNGTRVFGAASGDPLIYFMDKTTAQVGTNVAATTTVGLASKSDSSAFVNVTGWSSL